MDGSALAPLCGKTSSNSLPTPSIIIEWENAELSESARSLRMLSQLSRQLDELAARFADRPEVILVYHERVISGLALMTMIKESALNWNAEIRVIPAPDELKYYTIKNFGSKQTSREIVLLLDSDVVPEDGWLESILIAFRDKRVDVVCGETYIDPEDWYARAVGLFWVFPVRTSETRIKRVGQFWANNVAFRRAVFESYPFPEAELFRGQCGMLAGELHRAGRRIFRHAGAKVSHPPPNGLFHFFCRAVCTGSDYCQRSRWASRASVMAGLDELFEDFRIMHQRISSRCKATSAKRIDRATAYTIGSAFYIMKFVGYLLSLYDNRLIARYFPI